jgi:tetratricopeptide (TPR) repeat protein/predicted Ser/Thr protein kinase
MPSSPPEDWRDRLREDLTRDERDRTAGSATEAADRGAARLPRVPRYEIREFLGEGAAGVVHRAWDRELQRPVAVKVLRQTVGASDVARQRFRREAQTAASLSHPNVVAAYDAGEDAGILFLVMELVEGRPLSEALREKSRGRADLVRVLEKAARGVGAAHAKGIVHRDLKPSNILLTASGEPKVADFGLVHLVDATTELTRTGSALGTPLYMAPEQVEGRVREITPRTDVYSLGAILYEILTGRPPHQGATPMEIYGKIVGEEPAPPGPDVPRDLATIALKALDQEPARRYATAADLADDVGRHLAGEPVRARSSGLGYRLYRRWRRHRLVSGLGVGAALALAAAAAVGLAARAQREKTVDLLRDHARVSLEAVLKLRRAGANHEMGSFVPRLEAAYRQAQESAPDLPEIHYLMGRMYRALMEDEKAEAVLQRALAADPEYAPALYELTALYAAQYGIQMGKAIAQARRLPPGPVTAKAARELPAVDPDDVETGTGALADLRRNVLHRCEVLQRVLESGRAKDGLHRVGEAHLRTIRGMIAFHRREYEEARKILEGVVREDPTLEEAWGALGTTAARQASLLDLRSPAKEDVLKKYDEADALWGLALSHDQGYVPHWLGRASVRRSRGLCFMKRGGDAVPDFRRAEEDLSRTIALTEKVPEAWYRRGNVRDLKAVCLMGAGQDPVGDLDGAEGDLTEGISRFGERTEFRISRAGVRTHRALYLSRKGRDPLPVLAAAEEDLRAAIGIDPAVADAWNSSGYLKLVRGDFRKRRGGDPLPDFDAAVRDLTEAIRVNRDHAVAWNNRGRVLTERGAVRSGRGEDPREDFHQAEEDLTEALRLAPGSAESWGLRGRVRKHLGQCGDKDRDAPKAAGHYAAAVNDFSKALELNPSLAPTYAGELAEARRRLEALRPP